MTLTCEHICIFTIMLKNYVIKTFPPQIIRLLAFYINLIGILQNSKYSTYMKTNNQFIQFLLIGFHLYLFPFIFFTFPTTNSENKVQL